MYGFTVYAPIFIRSEDSLLPFRDLRQFVERNCYGEKKSRTAHAQIERRGRLSHFQWAGRAPG
jgi:hypothetical protein